MKQKDSKTQQNLMTAFLRESGAFNEYTFYAEQAKADGYEDIYRTFKQFAMNEQAHARVWFNLFHGVSTTVDNLKDAADLENYERSVMYADFADTAKREGFTDIAELFEGVSRVEGQHEEKYKEFYKKVKDEKVFESEEEVSWQCLNCGHIHTGKTPPETCPVCSHPKAYFKILSNQ